jgi:RHS repeat-associated protein
VASRHDFLPFGEELTTSNRTAALAYGVTDNVMQKYTGKERDLEGPGLDFFHARYFQGAQGRFGSPDWSAKPQPAPYAKLDNPQSLNLYEYVLNNPLSRMDPDGHIDCSGKNAQGAGCQAIAKWNAEHGIGQNAAGGTGSLSDVWQRLKHLFGFKTPYVTTRLVPDVPDFYSLNVSVAYVSASLSYVPATDDWVFSPAGNYPKSLLAASATAGWSKSAFDYLTGPSLAGCGFYGAGGCLGYSTSGTPALQVGVGSPQGGVSGGYGMDWNWTSIILGTYQALPVENPSGAVGIGSGLVYNPCMDAADCW